MARHPAVLPRSTARWRLPFQGHIGKVLATMSLLSRNKPDLAKALFLFAIIVFLAAPAPSFVHARVSAIGPTIAWAGSPDETLKPPPTPPRRAARLTIVAGSTADRSAAPRQYLNVTGRDLSARHLFGIVWRVYWATVRL